MARRTVSREFENGRRRKVRVTGDDANSRRESEELEIE